MYLNSFKKQRMTGGILDLIRFKKEYDELERERLGYAAGSANVEHDDEETLIREYV